jgi:hypothetical protein
VLTDKIKTTNGYTLSLMNGEYEHTYFSFNTKNIRYEGDSMDRTKIKFSDDPGIVFSIGSGSLSLNTLSVILSSSHTSALFSLSSTGSLSLSQCKITFYSSSSTISSSLVSITGGTVSFTQCILSSLTLTNTPLLQISTGGKLLLDGTEISGMTRRTGDGAGVMGTVGSGVEV